ncbi:MAG: 4a-hydroxytetrahydrobiopterin dehydratase [Candidatus Omnitrophota bacterium]|nr:4a-hydroxytetrahydrobiopterin dehydratase [Candidatus Omnitrophota bacterium]MDZ4241772.1 4a-hydroxytetrahydrobiopterin dehydratase [Candidatus Omnitrophota bacterium]
MDTPLAQKKCTPCEGKSNPLSAEAAGEYLTHVPGWALQPDAKAIAKDFTMKNFLAAVRFIEKIAVVAEEENHHPDIHLTGYRKLRVELSTHAIGGLSDNDFILAAKIDQLPAELKERSA